MQKIPVSGDLFVPKSVSETGMWFIPITKLGFFRLKPSRFMIGFNLKTLMELNGNLPV